MAEKRIGKQSISFEHPPMIRSYAAVAGKKESEGPLGAYIDTVCEDPMFGRDSWEKAEAELLNMTIRKVIDQVYMQPNDIDLLIAGDLLGQTMATSFGTKEFQIPIFGLYGACSAMGEALLLASMLLDGGFANRIIAATSSHFASAEKQFRFPLGYGNQRALSATWTVTGSGAVLMESVRDCSERAAAKYTRITGATIGKIVDYGIKDAQNMGACMAPAAADLIKTHLQDFGTGPEAYDRIITGDLGRIGQKILFDLLKEEQIDITGQHMDCGIEIFDWDTQDTHAGGSGCGCSAVTLCSYILKQLEQKVWKKVLFIPTGALLSKISFNEGMSIPGIAQGVVIESPEG